MLSLLQGDVNAFIYQLQSDHTEAAISTSPDTGLVIVGTVSLLLVLPLQSRWSLCRFQCDSSYAG